MKGPQMLLQNALKLDKMLETGQNALNDDADEDDDAQVPQTQGTKLAVVSICI